MFLTDLRPLYDLPGPWISVYLDASRATERGAEEVGLRWRAARESLLGSGADPGRVDDIGRLVSGDDTPGRHGLAVIANVRDDATHVEQLSDPPLATSAELGPLPHVLPMLEQRGEQVSWLRVIVDRRGGEIEQAVAGRRHRIESVERPEHRPIGKENWDRNASDVADAALRLAEEAEADVLIVAGDVRARQLFVGELPRHWRERTLQTGWADELGADSQRLDETTHEAVREIAAARIEDALDRYRLRSAHGSAEPGLAATVSALQRGIAEAVIVNPSTLDGVKLWVGPEPAYLAIDRSELLRLGVANPQPVAAGDGLVRAIACTGAELYVVDEPDFLGVLLR